MSTMTRYEPFGAFRRLRDEMDRAIGEFPARVRDASAVPSAWAPAVDIREEADRFVIAADVPGVDPESIEVTTEKNVLTIKGERTVEKRDEDEGRFRRVERLHGTFHRRFTLPESADAERISAQGKHGVLEVTIPKKAQVAPRRIEVAA